jgi:tetraacyldisaccharide 4'-kinase
MSNLNLDLLWYSQKKPLWPLLPLSYLYLLVIKLRQLFYWFFFKPKLLPVPVIVIGNITVGGTGKTPLLIYLGILLKEAGFKPGIISRGYGGNHQAPMIVQKTSASQEVGDEALLIHHRLDCPMVVGKNRYLAAKKLLATATIDIILADDGLQHYTLPRDLEIAVIDSVRQCGNGAYLPVGPLRESITRLNSVDFLILNTAGIHQQSTSPLAEKITTKPYYMHYTPKNLYQITQSEKVLALEALKGETVHAVAGIGDPSRFFKLLTEHGLQIIPHPYPDHHVFKKEDIEFFDNRYIIMTEKDAVKCTEFSSERHWVLAIDAVLDSTFSTEFLKRIEGLQHGQKIA